MKIEILIDTLFVSNMYAVNREMVATENWPDEMDYVACDNYTGSNTPHRSLDLRSFFVNVPEPATYGQFIFANDNVPFNGYSRLAFDMDIYAVSLNSENANVEQYLGSWTADFHTPLKLESNIGLDNFKPQTIHRVFTVVVLFTLFFFLFVLFK